MRVLIACEESQAVCKAFRKLGHEAFSCDILPCSGGHPKWHIQGDVLEQLDKGWDLMIAHPPCTYLSNAAAGHLFPKGVLNKERYEQGVEGKEFFMKLLNCDIPKICVENPTPSRIFELPKHTQIIQPFEHGEPFQKRTLLWLKNLPIITPSKMMDEREPTTKAGGWYNKCGSGVSRRVARSKTFPGIAKAMAEQWGSVPCTNEDPSMSRVSSPNPKEVSP